MQDSVKGYTSIPRIMPRSLNERWDSQFVNQTRTGWSLGVAPWAQIQEDESLPVIIAIGSGKGGVGKSLISANIGAELARLGNRTLVIDLDIGGANLHTYFGKSHPEFSLDDFFDNPSIPFSKLILPSAINGLGVVAGGRSDERNARKKITTESLFRLWRGIVNCKANYNIDFVLLDLGAGTHTFTIELFTLAHVGIITVLPEPTSIENAYVFLKACLMQLILNLGKQLNLEKESEALLEALYHLSARSLDRGYLSAIRSEYQNFPELIRPLGSVVLARKLGILVNQAREREDREISQSMNDICRSFFGFQSSNLSYLNYDEAAWRSLRNQRLLVSDFPHSVIVQRLQQVTQKILDMSK